MTNTQCFMDNFKENESTQRFQRRLGKIMPRVGFIGVRVSEEDRMLAKRIRDEASEHPNHVLTMIRHVESFVSANDFTEATTPVDRVWQLFAAQWINSGRAASSLAAMMQDLRKFRVCPFRTEEARRRVEEYRTRNGIERLARRQGKLNPRRVPIEPLPGIPMEQPNDMAEVDRLCFWAAICLTGNRATNVLQLRRMEITTTRVMVDWGPRKTRSNTRVTYLLTWCAVPPAWVTLRLNSLDTRPWPFPNPKTIAAAVNSWLRRWGLVCTSTSPRERLDLILQDEVRLGRLLEADYVVLMDHKLEIGLGNYSAGRITPATRQPEE